MSPIGFVGRAPARAADSRAEILARVRANQPANMPLPPVRVNASALQTHLETFAANLERMGGELVSIPEEADLEDWIRRRYPDASVICSATAEVAGTRPIGQVHAPAELEDVDVGVVRAALGIVETGSVLLTERHLGINALGFLAQHLVVLLDPSALVPDLHHAYRDPSYTNARYTVLLTGPSATADIEGILVRGAQGARSLAVVARHKQEP